MQPLKKAALSIIFALGLLFTPAGIPFSAIQPAQAQTPTIDLSSLAKLKEIIGTVNEQLGQLNGIFNTINQINKVIGAVGSGNITGILGMLGLDVGNLEQCIGAVQNISRGGFGSGGLSSIQGLLGGLQGCSSSIGLAGIKPTLPDLGQLGNLASVTGFGQQYQSVTQAFQSGATIGTASNALKQGLYLSGGITQQSVENTNAIRGIVARQSAVDAFGVAIQGKTYLEKAPEDIKTLSENAKQAKDLRGDLAVNNAIMLKVLEQLQQQNAQIAALLQMNSSGFIANDTHTFTSAGNSGNQ